jgi:pimeloyl-ACP methyl ester carboxylesterase
MIHFVGADDNQIAGEDVGPSDGRLVLFLHGGGQTRHTWRGAQEALALLGFRSISLDARGHGDSDWTTQAGYSLESAAADLRQVVKSVGGPVSIVGASWGGLASLLALTLNSDLDCEALILVDVVPRPNKDGVANILTFMDSHQAGFASPEDAADAVAGYVPGRRRPASADGLRKNLRQADNGRFYWHWDPAFLEFTGDLGKFAPALEASLQRSDVPILLVRGLRSDVVTDEEVLAFQQLAPHVPVADICDAGHMLVGDQNDAFIGAIVDFLDRRLVHEGGAESGIAASMRETET